MHLVEDDAMPAVPGQFGCHARRCKDDVGAGETSGTVFTFRPPASEGHGSAAMDAIELMKATVEAGDVQSAVEMALELAEDASVSGAAQGIVDGRMSLAASSMVASSMMGTSEVARSEVSNAASATARSQARSEVASSTGDTARSSGISGAFAGVVGRDGQYPEVAAASADRTRGGRYRDKRSGPGRDKHTETLKRAAGGRLIEPAAEEGSESGFQPLSKDEHDSVFGSGSGSDDEAAAEIAPAVPQSFLGVSGAGVEEGDEEEEEWESEEEQLMPGVSERPADLPVSQMNKAEVVAKSLELGIDPRGPEAIIRERVTEVVGTEQSAPMTLTERAAAALGWSTAAKEESTGAAVPRDAEAAAPRERRLRPGLDEAMTVDRGSLAGARQACRLSLTRTHTDHLSFALIPHRGVVCLAFFLYRHGRKRARGGGQL